MLSSTIASALGLGEYVPIDNETFADRASILTDDLTDINYTY
jgi:hypothetical protein